ncbi:MAG: hypothetical protein NZM38_07820 [Cytophagales bacterium]|nr:hypothetical protein [Cytophagales bacterium]MDW8384664.1 hypothetical protein [Flammeovirgaceae bacterium]
MKKIIATFLLLGLLGSFSYGVSFDKDKEKGKKGKCEKSCTKETTEKKSSCSRPCGSAKTDQPAQ